MGKPKDSSKTGVDRAFDLIGAIVPSCGSAMKMVELGQKRPLSLREKFVLLYNTPLCSHCNCKRESFNKERAKMREISEERRTSNVEY